MRLKRALYLLAGLVIVAGAVQSYYRTSPKPRPRRVAHGAIRNADGSHMTGVKGQVCFCPVLPDRPHDIGPYERGELKATRLTGSIRSDGTFELWTTSNADGAEPSLYKVFFLEAENESPGPPIVPGAYLSYEHSDWVVALRPDQQEEISLRLGSPKVHPDGGHPDGGHPDDANAAESEAEPTESGDIPASSPP